VQSRWQEALPMNDNEVGVFIMLGGIALFAGEVTALEWWGRRQERWQNKQ
jgi:hypothetical protein